MWTPSETDFLYVYLQLYGLDFGFLSALLPAYTRDQVKTKFRYELQQDPTRVHAALAGTTRLAKTPFVDFEQLLAVARQAPPQRPAPPLRTVPDVYTDEWWVGVTAQTAFM
jgi:hypothetical protein